MTDIDVLYKIILLGDAGVGKTNLLACFTSGTLDIPKDTQGVALSFNEARRPTIGVEFGSKTIVNADDGTRIRAQIWDTAGQERYRAITSSHYRRAAGAVLVFDVTSRQSYENAKNVWLKELNAARNVENGVLLKIALVGNKMDKFNAQKANAAKFEPVQRNSTVNAIDRDRLIPASAATENNSIGRVKSQEEKVDSAPDVNGTAQKEDCQGHVTKEEHEMFCKENGLLYKRTSAKTGEGVIEAFDELILAVHKHFQKMDEEDAAPVVVIGSKQDQSSAPGCC